MEKNCLLSIVLIDFKGSFIGNYLLSWSSLEQKLHASNGPEDITRKEQAGSHPTKAFSKRDFWMGVGSLNEIPSKESLNEIPRGQRS